MSDSPTSSLVFDDLTQCSCRPSQNSNLCLSSQQAGGVSFVRAPVLLQLHVFICGFK